MNRSLGLSIVICLTAGLGAWLYAFSGEANIAPVVRAGAIELVDEHGRVRAELDVEDETVVLRLRDADGVIRVKLGASREGSGLLLLDQSTQPGIHMLAQRETSIAILEDGEMRQIRP